MLALVLGTSVLACCAPSPSREAPAREINTRLDGWYRGQRLPVSRNGACSDRPRKVWFRVEHGQVEVVTSRHRHSARLRPLLTGTVSAYGELALRTGTGHAVTGRIDGDNLTASDLPETAVLGETRSGCLHRFEAFRRDAREDD